MPESVLDREGEPGNRRGGVAGRSGFRAPRTTPGALGPYALQAAIAACHAGSYAGGDRLGAHHRAVRCARRAFAVAGRGAQSCGRGGHGIRSEAGLELVDALTSEASLANYHLLPSVRRHLLATLDRFEEARGELERAAALLRNAREREVLLERASACYLRA